MTKEELLKQLHDLAEQCHGETFIALIDCIVKVEDGGDIETPIYDPYDGTHACPKCGQVLVK